MLGMSQEELFAVVNEIQLTSLPGSSSLPAASSMGTDSSVLITDPGAQESNSNSPPVNADKRKDSHIHSLIGMLSEQGMCASTDDELLDDRCGKNRKETSELVTHKAFFHKSESVPANIIKYSRGVDYSVERSPVSSDIASESPSLKTSNGSIIQTHITSSMMAHKGTKVTSTTLFSPHGRTNRANSLSQDGFSHMGDHHFTTRRADSDSDNSDFEMFVPPRRRVRHPSEPCHRRHNVVTKQQNELRSSSPPENTNNQDHTIKKSYPTLTKQPVRYPKTAKDKKSMSADSFCYNLLPGAAQEDENQDHLKSRRLIRTRSLEVSPNSPATQVLNPSAEHNRDDGKDSSDEATGGTLVDVQLFQKNRGEVQGKDATTMNSNVLHRLDVMCEGDSDEDDSVGCTYLDPKDLEECCELVKRKERRQIPVQDSDNDISQTYLTLTNIKKSDDIAEQCKPKECTIPLRKPSSTLGVNSSMERWRRTVDLADSSCCSGYSTDTSSGWGEFECDLDNIKPLRRLQSLRKRKMGVQGGQEVRTLLSQAVRYIDSDTLEHSYSRSPVSGQEEGTGDDDGSEIYEEIDDLDLDSKGVEANDEAGDGKYALSHSQSFPNRHSLPHISNSIPLSTDTNTGNYTHSRGAVRTLPSSRENLYASLMSVTNLQKHLQQPPTLPPRPLRKLSSLDPRESERGHMTKEQSYVPGVSISEYINI